MTNSQSCTSDFKHHVSACHLFLCLALWHLLVFLLCHSNCQNKILSLVTNDTNNKPALAGQAAHLFGSWTVAFIRLFGQWVFFPPVAVWQLVPVSLCPQWGRISGQRCGRGKLAHLCCALSPRVISSQFNRLMPFTCPPTRSRISVGLWIIVLTFAFVVPFIWTCHTLTRQNISPSPLPSRPVCLSYMLV